MKTMKRRNFIFGLSAAAIGIASTHVIRELTVVRELSGAHEPDLEELWLSAQGRNEKTFGLGYIQPNQSQSLLTGFRGHGLCQNPQKSKQVIMFARRPGTKGVVFDLKSNEVTQEFFSPPNYHMHGHGCFSQNGELLFCAESDYTSGEGKITIRETQHFEVVKELRSYGVGPHEVALMPDGQTLAVANGGLLTHPNSGRKILNLDSMDSNLSHIDVSSGNLIKQFRVPEKTASIRHIDIASNGTIAIAIQVQRDATEHNKLIPLAGILKPDSEKIDLLEAPKALWSKLNDYMGSVRIHTDNISKKQTAAFTSPRGDLAMFWNAGDNKFLGFHEFHDVCGLSISKNNRHYVLSNSTGKVRFVDATTLVEATDRRLHYPNMSWDNHMITISPA